MRKVTPWHTRVLVDTTPATMAHANTADEVTGPMDMEPEISWEFAIMLLNLLLHWLANHRLMGHWANAFATAPAATFA